jgi:hypothetical protein
MAAYTNAQLITKLSTQLRDSSDARWTSSEKTEAVAEALEDPAFSYYAEDDTLTASTSTQAYTVPTGVETVVDIAIEDAGGVEARINPSLWEQKYGKIIFNKYPPLAGTMNITAIKHYITTDSIPYEMANLALAIAGKICYEMLEAKFVSHFLTNDVSLAEIQMGIARYDRKIREERSKMGRNANRIGYKI